MSRYETIKVNHKCTLPHEEDVIVRYIDSGWFVYCRRRFRNFLLANKKHPNCKDVLKSTDSIRNERARHLQHYYWIIHPFSVGRAYWQFFMIVVYTCGLIVIPINFSGTMTMWHLRITKLVFDFGACCDIVMNFFTGYYHRQTKRIVLTPSLIAKQYICSYFVIDMLSAVPIHFLVTTLFGYYEELPALEPIIFCKTFRLITLMKYLNVLRDWYGFRVYKFRIFKVAVAVFISMLWCSSINYVIARNNPSSWAFVSQYALVDGLIHGCFKSAYVLFLIGHEDAPVTSDLGKVLQTLGLQLGFVLKLYFLAQVVQMLRRYNSSGSKYDQHMKQMDEYVRYKGLPEWMKRRIYRYCDFRYQKHFVKEDEINSILTPHLRQEIMLQDCHEFLEKVTFFQGLPTALLVKVISLLKVVIVLPNDVIIRAGSQGDSMYFISFGTVAVFTSQGKEICHLGDGAYFGEIALVIEEKRVASVVAVDSCELLQLHRVDFQNALEPYPEYFARLRKMAQDRLQGVQSYVRDNRDDITPNI